MSGQKRHAQGVYTGTGATLTVEVGFLPTKVKLTSRAGDEATFQRNVGDTSMPDAAMHKRTAAGVGSYVTSLGITPTDTGFTIGADTDLNVSAELVDWEAID